MSGVHQGIKGAHVGHAHLKVSDLERSVAFYRDIIGMHVTARFGDKAAFMSFDGYHHHLGLNVWHSAGATPPPHGHTGLFHVAFVLPDRKALGQAIARVRAAGHVLSGAADHGVSEAVYLDDPDGNGIELYRDRPEAEWPRSQDGSLMMTNRPLDIDALLAE